MSVFVLPTTTTFATADAPSDVSCAPPEWSARAEYRTPAWRAATRPFAQRSTTVRGKTPARRELPVDACGDGRNTRRPSGRARRAPPPDRPPTHSAFHPEVPHGFLFACVRGRSCSPASPRSAPREPSRRQRTLSFDEWWGRPGRRHAHDTTASTAARLTFGVRDIIGRHAAKTREHARAAAPLEPRGHRFDRPRSRAGRRRRAAHLRPSARTRPLEPRDGHRPHRRLRGRQRDRSPLRELPGRAGDRTTASMDAAIAQAAHDTLVALYPSQKAQCDAAARGRSGHHAGRHRPRGTASLLGRVVAAGDPAEDAQRRLEPPRAALRRRLHRRQRAGEWRQDPISQLPPALGARWGTVRPFVVPSGRDLPRAASAAAVEHGLRRRLQRGEASRRRRHHDADRAHRRPDDRRHLLGLRRHAVAVRAAAALQPDRRGDRHADGIGRGRAGAPLRAGQRRDGRRRHRDLGVEVLLQAVAAGHRDPRSRSGHRTDGHRRPQPADRAATRRTARSARRPATWTGRTSRRRSRPIRPATPASAARSSRSCATSTGATTSPSRSSPTS